MPRLKYLDDQIAQWGGIAETEAKEAAIGNHLWRRAFWHIQRCGDFATRASRHESDRKLEIEFVNHAAFNARATICLNRDGEPVNLIAVNVGTIYILFQTFSRLFSHPEVASNVAGSDLEEAERTFIADLPSNLQGANLVLPNSPERFGMALTLTGIGLDFLLHHELGHLVNGHVDYLTSVQNLTAIDEDDQLRSAHVDITRYTLEYDADAFATLQTLVRGFDLVERIATSNQNDSKLQQDVSVTTIYRSISSYAHYFGFATYVFFKLFYRGPEAIFSSETHPAQQVRLHWSLSLLATMEITSKFNMTRSDIESAVKGALEAEIAIAKVNNRKPDFEMIHIGMLQGSSKSSLLIEIRKEWRRIRPLLEPLSRGGKLAPADSA